MFRSVISPIQSWLLSQGRCVGCGKDLSEGKTKKGKGSLTQVVCDCRRVYLQNPKTKEYKRALPKEVI